MLLPPLLPSRTNDIFIMEQVINYGSFKPKQLQQINTCRIYLQATTLSDIIKGNGYNFNMTYKCIKDQERQSPYLWPQQPRPGPKSRRLWKKALKTCFPNTNKILHQPLGRWLRPPHQWKWFYNPVTNKLFHLSNNQWQIWRRRGRGRIGSRPKFTYYCNCIFHPTNIHPATVSRHGHLTTLTGYTTINHEAPQLQLPPTWGDPAILNHSTILTPQQQQLLLLHLATNSITIISDGSYHPDHQLGTAAWIIDLNNQSSIANGYYQCPGNNSDQS